jgi:pimeloyl-ACP methyl ester carboxylesterase
MPAVHHVVKGAGPPLILIHGFCETSALWNRFSDALAEKFCILAPDLPGFGRSPLPAVPFTLDDIARLMLEWMVPWNDSQPVVIGHSLGGYVALSMAHHRADRFGGLGLFHSTARADTPEKKENRNKVIDFVNRRGVAPYVDTFVPGLFCKPQNPRFAEVHQMALQTTLPALTAYAAAMRDRAAYDDVLVTFSRPMLFIAGQEDALLPLHQIVGETKLARFPVFHSLPDTGHIGMVEKEGATRKIVEDFMDLCLDFKANQRH